MLYKLYLKNKTKKKKREREQKSVLKGQVGEVAAQGESQRGGCIRCWVQTLRCPAYTPAPTGSGRQYRGLRCHSLLKPGEAGPRNLIPNSWWLPLPTCASCFKIRRTGRTVAPGDMSPGCLPLCCPASMTQRKEYTQLAEDTLPFPSRSPVWA